MQKNIGSYILAVGASNPTVLINGAMQRDVDSHLTAVGAYNPIVLNSSVGGDEAEVNGFAIDRNTVRSSDYPLQNALQAAVQYSYSLAAAKQCVLGFNLQHSTATSAGWADYDAKDGSTRQTVTIGTTGSTGAQTGNGTLRANFNLASAERYVRMQVEADFTATATDDLDVGAMLVFDGLAASTAAEDNVEQNGLTVDRELVRPGYPLQQSCQVAINYGYSLAAAETCVLTWNLQHSSAASSWTDFDDEDGTTGQTKTIGSTSSTAAQTGNGTARANFNLSGAKRYVRSQYKANFLDGTTAAQDDLDVSSMIVFGGYDTVPASTAGV